MLRCVIRSEWNLSGGVDRCGFFVASFGYGFPLLYKYSAGQESALRLSMSGVVRVSSCLRTFSTAAMLVFSILEVVRRTTAYSIRRNLPFLQTNFVGSNQVKGLATLPFKTL